MKKALFTMLFMFLGITATFAQKVTVPEPEFADQTYLLTSNSEYVKLPREAGVVKTKAGASLYLTGIGKVKTRFTLSGKTAAVSAPAGQDVRLIVRAANNSTDPESFINIFPFEVKGKERRAQLAEVGTLSAAKENSLGQINFQAKKYGTSSYLIVMKLTHPYGKKSRIGLHWNEKTKTLERVPYLIVPFSWGTPKTVTFHRIMSIDLYDEVRHLKKSTVTGETHFEDNWNGEAIERHEYEFRERYKADDKSAAENGMVRMSDMITGKSTYFTFRVISARSPQKSWLQKGIPARHVTEGLTKEYSKTLISAVQEALKTDLGQ